MSRSKKAWNRKAKKRLYRCLHLASAEYPLGNEAHTKAWWVARFHYTHMTSIPSMDGTITYWGFKFSDELTRFDSWNPDRKVYQRCEFELIEVL